MMRVVDTLSLARRKHPGAPNNLDALCARYGIDNSRRTKHGALLDAELLSEVYIELIGGKQADLDLSLRPAVAAQSSIVVAARSARRGLAPHRRRARRSPRLRRELGVARDLARLRGHRRIAVIPGRKRSGAPRKGGCYAAGVPPAAAGPGCPGAAWLCSAAFWRYSATKSIGSM